MIVVFFRFITMGDQNVSKVEPVDFNSSNGGQYLLKQLCFVSNIRLFKNKLYFNKNEYLLFSIKNIKYISYDMLYLDLPTCSYYPFLSSLSLSSIYACVLYENDAIYDMKEQNKT